MKELTLQVIYLILFMWFRCKGCLAGFTLIKYTYVAYLKSSVWFVFVLLFDCFVVS